MTNRESHFSGKRLLILLTVSVGIWGSFAWWSVLQEKLLTRPYTTETTQVIDGVTVEKPTTFNFPFFLNLVAYLACVFLAAMLQTLGGFAGLVTPFKQVDPFRSFTMGMTLSLGTPFGYSAMQHLSYPVVLAGKMCKPIPTMIIGFFVYRQRYDFLKYTGVLLLTFGVLGFALLGEGKKNKKTEDGEVHNTSLMGLILIGINLLFDGYTQSSQDAIIKKSNPGPLQMMILANGIAAFFATCMLTVAELVPNINKIPVVQDVIMKQEFTKAMDFLVAHPQAFFDLANMACLGAVGQVFIFAGITYFGTLTVMGLTVSRKIGSVLLSIWMHNHSQTTAQLVCLGLVVVGILIDSYISVMSKKKATHAANHHHKNHHHEAAAVEANHGPRKTTDNNNVRNTAAAAARRSKKEN